MLRPEIEYWLSRGNTIFKHRGMMWLCLRNETDNHRIMIEVEPFELNRVNKLLYVETPLTIRGADGTVYTN